MLHLGKRRRLLALSVALAATGCTTIGTGTDVLVLADPPRPQFYQGTDFDHLFAKPDAARVITLNGDAIYADADWAHFSTLHAASTGRSTARVGVSVRDQTNTPALDYLNVETTSVADINKFLAEHPDAAAQEKFLTALKDHSREMPESYSRLVRHSAENVGPLQGFLYHYFPQVTIDLTAALNSAQLSDRFDYVAAAIRIPDGVHARFINFSPKAADFFDFTLGTLKQTASLTAAATAGRTSGTSQTATDTRTTGLQNVLGTTGGGTFGASLSGSLSDEFTRDLKSSLDSRAAGIFDNGRVFMIALRSNDQRRIASTYTFNLMLEEPATLQHHVGKAFDTWQSIPMDKAIDVEIRTIGIIRHVIVPGRTGVLKRVPESLNDESFHEVVVHESKVPLWRFNNVPTGTADEITNFVIYTNRSDASFSAFSDKTKKLIFHGSGIEARTLLPTGEPVTLKFHPIVVAGDKGGVLTATDVHIADVSQVGSAIGNYLPTSNGKPNGEATKANGK